MLLPVPEPFRLQGLLPPISGDGVAIDTKRRTSVEAVDAVEPLFAAQKAPPKGDVSAVVLALEEP